MMPGSADAAIVQRYKESDVWHVNLLYLLGKEKPYSRTKVGDVVFAESGTIIKITELPGYPRAIGVAVTGPDLQNIPGLGSVAANGTTPKGKVTSDIETASEWILRQIPVVEADKIRKESKEPGNRFRDAVAVLDAGDKRNSTAQAAAGGVQSTVSRGARFAYDSAATVVKGAASVVSKVNDSGGELFKGIISATWDRLTGIEKSLITGGTAGLVDYAFRRETTEALLVGGAAGGGMYLWTRNQTTIGQTDQEKKEAAEREAARPENMAKMLPRQREEVQRLGYEKAMIVVYGDKETAIKKEDQWRSLGPSKTAEMVRDPEVDYRVRAVLEEFLNGKQMTR